jgi:DNA-binding CsgD family transcriptional regulator
VTTFGLAGISGREAEVLHARRDHLTNAEIAARLPISVRTVESHVSSLRRKLGAGDRRDLAVLAASVGPLGGTGPGGPGPAAGGGLIGIPATRTTFIGRTAELADLATTLDADRLVTLVGPGGVGKTRLAVEAVRLALAAFPGGGAFVDLVPVSAEFVVEAVAAALGGPVARLDPPVPAVGP